MRKLLIAACIFGLAALALGQNPNSAPLLALWSGNTWSYRALSPAFRITPNLIDVPVVQGPAGAPGQAGAPGPAGPAGPAPTFAANDVWVLTSGQATFALRCPVADVFWNGFLATEAVEYTTDGKTATFAPYTPTDGDVVKVIYRCQ